MEHETPKNFQMQIQSILGIFKPLSYFQLLSQAVENGQKTSLSKASGLNKNVNSICSKSGLSHLLWWGERIWLTTSTLVKGYKCFRLWIQWGTWKGSQQEMSNWWNGTETGHYMFIFLFQRWVSHQSDFFSKTNKHLFHTKKWTNSCMYDLHYYALPSFGSIF